MYIIPTRTPSPPLGHLKTSSTNALMPPASAMAPCKMIRFSFVFLFVQEIYVKVNAYLMRYFTLCSSPTERFHKPPAASSATQRFRDLANIASMLIPPSNATDFATSEFTERFAIA